MSATLHSIDIEAPRSTVQDVMMANDPALPWIGCRIRLEDLGGDITRAILVEASASRFPADAILVSLKQAAEDFRRAMS